MSAHGVRLAVVSATCVVTFAIHADSFQPSHWCGTSLETIDQTRALASWARDKQRFSAKTALEAPDFRRSGDLFIIDPDSFMTPFDNPADLVGRTMIFTPASDSTFTVRTSGLAYDNAVGTALVLPEEGTNDALRFALQRFEFPFLGKTIREVWISERFGVFLSIPALERRTKFGPLDIATAKEGVIAPYLHTGLPRTLGRTTRELFVKESADTLTVTWRAMHDPLQPYNPLNDGELDVQLVLSADGTIRFSWRTLTNIAWGTVLITSGEEAARQTFHTVAESSDAVGDVNRGAGSSAMVNLLDIRHVDVQRVDGSELVRVRLQLGGRVYPGSISGFKGFTVRFNEGSALSLEISGTFIVYCVPGWGCTTGGAQVEFLDDGVVFYVLDRYLTGSSQVVVSTRAGGTVDSLTIPLTELGSARSVEVNLSDISSESSVAAPVFEAFTLPVLNPEVVWERLRNQFALWDSEVDGVAIFQNFTTDIRTYATAYSTVGNTQADGVWAEADDFYGPALPRSPALLHMNEVEPDRQDEGSLRYRDFLLGHELGHRWLYGFQIVENGQLSKVLSPTGGHPAQYVHTPAAFPVFTSRDYSVMGGSDFQDLGAGRFRTPRDLGAFGYSWHELYLMGLASPAEVGDWFYLADTDPELGRSYNPPPDLTVMGRKVNVGLPQVIEAMGPRRPVSDDSQKRFRVLVVLIEKSGSRAADDETILAEYAARFPGYFSVATGGRGEITMTLPQAPVAAFTFRAVAPVWSAVAFRDTSGEYPASWRWDFGDGSTSTEQFPHHSFRTSGTYIVTLTVQNSRGSSKATQSIRIEPNRRRGARR